MNQIKNISLLRWSVVFFYLLTIVINYISQVAPFNGQTNGEVSDKYATLFTPADYAFSIWGLIYLALGVYVFFQALWAPPENRAYEKIGQWLILSFLATSAWLPAFQYEMIGLSVAIMLIVLVSLTMITIILAQDTSIDLSTKRWLKIPFGLYLGWISVATIVNITVWLKYSSWTLWGMEEVSLWGIGETNWLFVMLAVGVVLAVLVSKKGHNAIIALVFVWAYVAIAFQENQSHTIYIYALISAAILVVTSLYLLYRQYVSK